MAHRQSNLFTIPPGEPFLTAFSRALVDGQLVDVADPRSDPLALASTTIYVPTRRAGRELRSIIADALPGRSRFLPTIRPLGEFDEAAAFFLNRHGFREPISEPMGTMERQLILARLVRDWSTRLPRSLSDLYGEEEVWSPASDSDAVWMASELAALLDSFAAQGLDPASMPDALSPDVGRWWELSAHFLEIVGQNWPLILAERNRSDPATHRNALIRAEAARLAALPSPDPVIVAGSTGSMAATADLIAAVARRPNCAVVLPGFDTGMPDTVAQILDASPPGVSAVSHSQYGMKRLLRFIGATPGMVQTILSPDADRLARQRWVATALQPAETTGDWSQAIAQFDPAASSQCALIEAANESAEAAAIAAAMRHGIGDPAATVALVTPDRALAGRVCAELQRFSITASDSAGQPFAVSSHGRFLDLCLQVVFDGCEPATLLALTKHPLFRLGSSAGTVAGTVSLFERLVLRGSTGRFDAATTADFGSEQIARRLEQERHLPRHLRTLDAQAFASVQTFCHRLHEALAPLAALNADAAADVTLVDAARILTGTLEALARDDEGELSDLYDGAGGSVLAGFLESIAGTDAPFSFKADELPSIIAALSSGLTVVDEADSHPRVHIWGALEARLQCADTMILAGLNEGTWPSNVQNDAFLTRGQKQALGLEPPERRIGLAAHDFQMGMGNPSVILSRSLRSEGAPTVASRWLQRLCAITPADALETMRARGRRYVQLAAAVRTPANVEPIARPAPVVPLELRPKQFSVTDIENLRRDPYGIFARKVLDLSPFENLVRDPDSAERGKLLHEIMERAVNQGGIFDAPDPHAALAGLARTIFDEAELPGDIRTIWWPRFENAVDDIIEWERERQGTVAARFAEIKARYIDVEQTGCTLGARADRMDVLADGSVDIVDYKTGSVPSKTDIKSLWSAQLVLEACLLQRGAFAETGTRTVNDFIYLKFATTGLVPTSEPARGGEGGDLSDIAWQRLVALLTAYNDPDRGYLSHAVRSETNYTPPYDHLARVREWSIDAPDDDAGDA